MKLRDAETLLQTLKDEGPIQEHWSVLTDEGITLEAWPLGFARGSHGLQDLITARTINPRFKLFEGFEQPTRIRSSGGHGLWQQEMFVYLREMREALNKAVTGITDAPFFPRTGEYRGYDVDSTIHADYEPSPEDFHLFAKPRAVRWRSRGTQDISDAELEAVKDEFCLLLNVFIHEEKWNGQRQVVRIRTAVSPEEDQGTRRRGNTPEVGSAGAADDDDWD